MKIYGVECEEPNNKLYDFNGRIFANKNSTSVNANNFLLQGASLVNTDWILGIVVFAGK